MPKYTKELERLILESGEEIPPWKKWGAYLSERSWGTVREDYSQDGNAWEYFVHDMARSKAYRWGEDGLGGISDYFQSILCSFAFWNGKDPILKERLFGLNSVEGNHGEDVKECYYYMDATPTQSYLKFLYKYPQNAFPYDLLVEENQRRSSKDREFEIYDTGVFDDGKYFDIFIEYAKAGPEDICIKMEIHNRGKDPAPLHVLPHLWFRNRWSWGDQPLPAPKITKRETQGSTTSMVADATGYMLQLRTHVHYVVSTMHFYGETPQEVLFTNNETHNERVYGPNVPSITPYVKDAFHRYIINKEQCVAKDQGTKACFHYGPMMIEPNKPQVLLFRLAPEQIKDPLKDVQAWIDKRKKEADEFYEAMQPSHLSEDDKRIQRTAFAGMIWSQQLYVYDVEQWLKGDNSRLPPPEGRGDIRNGKWNHLHAYDIISMPDKWEYPWFASWDLAFHVHVISLIDLGKAKHQAKLVLRHWYRHVKGQIPAYEWNFSDLNPPVQAWSFWKLYQQEKADKGEGDRSCLLFGFLKLVENFSWWVNKVDVNGNNLFEGGFLGLDNISVIDRSKQLPDGGMMEQSDATGWMGFYSLWMMRIALELSVIDPAYESLAINYLEQFIYISKMMHDTHEMWDEEDGFFYDVILNPNGKKQKVKIRSFVGIIPFYSLISLDENEIKNFTLFYRQFCKFKEFHPDDVERCVTQIDGKILFSLMDIGQMKKVLSRVFDPEEFFSDFGLRSVSKYHEKNPLYFGGSVVSYEPGESLEKIKGGNSNWRGPIWMPTNYLFLEAFTAFMNVVGKDYVIEIGNGNKDTVANLRARLMENLTRLFRKDEKGVRPLHGDCKLYHEDPYWKDLILFYEHYHGDTGRGLGATHQTGWSGLIANVFQQLDPPKGP